jgi:hypothetical protein
MATEGSGPQGLTRLSELVRGRGIRAAPTDRAVALTSLREKVVKIGAKVVAPGRYIVFQMVEGGSYGNPCGTRAREELWRGDSNRGLADDES